MGLSLAQALRLMPAASPPHPTVAFVGAGGKTTAMFQLARDLPPPVLVTTSTHLGNWQISLADQHQPMAQLQIKVQGRLDLSGVTLVTGPTLNDDRVSGPTENELLWLHDTTRAQHVFL